MIFPVTQFLWQEEDDLGNFVTLTYYEGFTSAEGSLSEKYDPDSGDTLIVIYLDSTVATLTLHNAKDGVTNLQVPTGKKWRVLLNIVSGGAASKWKIRASDTLDTNDGTVLFDQSLGINANNILSCPLLELPTGKFLTLERIAGTATVKGGIIVESDA